MWWFPWPYPKLSRSAVHLWARVRAAGHRRSSSNVRVELTRTETTRAQPGEEVDLVHQRGVDHDDAVRRHDGLPGADHPPVEAAVGQHRSTKPSEPKLGNDSASRPCSNATSAKSSTALTTPCPPRTRTRFQIATTARWGNREQGPERRDHWHLRKQPARWDHRSTRAEWSHQGVEVERCR